MGAGAALKEATKQDGGTAAGEQREQLALLPAVDQGRPLELQPEAPEGERRAGRPKGSRNRRTEETIEKLTALGHKSPLQITAELAGEWIHDPAGLARRMGMKRADATREVLDLLKAALPFWHSKASPDLDLGGGGPALVVQFGYPLDDDGGGGAEGGGQRFRVVQQREEENAGKSNT